jgi:hypothetical protein
MPPKGWRKADQGAGADPANPEDLTQLAGGDPAAGGPAGTGGTGGKNKKRESKQFFALSTEEITLFLHTILRIVFSLFGREYVYNQETWKSEAEGLKSLADKVHVLNVILAFFKPLYILLSIIDKFMSAPKKKRQVEPQTINVKAEKAA